MEDRGERAAVLSVNLRLLCERHGSISSICRKVKLNRQQFNKYLSGLHLPSQQNLRLISSFFGLNEAVLLSDPDEFRNLVEGNFFYAMDKVRALPEFNTFVESALLSAHEDHRAILGVYDRYQYSSIYKGKILRSAFCIYKNQDLLQHYYVERFPSHDDPSKMEYVFKYYGFVFPVAGRIFTADCEGIQRNELTFGVLAPVRRSNSKFMFGITTGIAATMFRQPYATKVALHYQTHGLLRRQHLTKLTVLDRDDPSIPRETLQFLGDGTDMIRLD